jgi:hypothetical protein
VEHVDTLALSTRKIARPNKNLGKMAIQPDRILLQGGNLPRRRPAHCAPAGIRLPEQVLCGVLLEAIAMQKVIALLILLIGMAPLPAHATQPAGQPYRIDFGNHLLTRVMIDGQGPFSFIIDTASSRTLLYEHVRTQLKLAQSQPGAITVYGINSNTEALPVEPAVLEVAGQEIRGLTLGVLPPTATATPGIDGILGIDVLDRYFVVLDRAAMRLMLLAPDSTATQFYRGWPSVTLTPRPLKNIPIEFWYMTAEIDHVRFTTLLEPARFTALLDLGADFTMMNWPAAEQLGVREKDFHLPKAMQDFVRDVLGTDEPVIKINALTIALGSNRWDSQTLLVANSDVFTHFNLDKRPAMILGAGLLRDNSLAIDFAGRRLFIGPMVHQSPEAETADAKKGS